MSNKVIHIALANPRGFCAGVDRAIEIVENALEKYGKPIYVRNEVVHNKYVIESLKQKGAIFVNDLKQVPENSFLIFSAHGVSKKVKADTLNYHLKSIDATCPLVTKVHKEVNRYLSEGYEILMIGHSGHPEVEGTLGQEADSKGKMHLIESLEDAKNIAIKNPNKLAFVTQTTLSLDETKEIISVLKHRFPNIQGPKADDICYATQNRQDAVKKSLHDADLFLVVGSKNSSNSNRLKELGDKNNIESYLIDDMNEFNPQWLDNKHKVLITAGASAPEVLTQALINTIKTYKQIEIEEIDGTEENIIFKLPKI
ncbi:MAG: 4-hydroxy-3-methylbut-2-enyl diphosphate reductase [Methylophilaceae bacterium]